MRTLRNGGQTAPLPKPCRHEDDDPNLQPTGMQKKVPPTPLRRTGHTLPSPNTPEDGAHHLAPQTRSLPQRTVRTMLASLPSPACEAARNPSALLRDEHSISCAAHSFLTSTPLPSPALSPNPNRSPKSPRPRKGNPNPNAVERAPTGRAPCTARHSRNPGPPWERHSRVAGTHPLWTKNIQFSRVSFTSSTGWSRTLNSGSGKKTAFRASLGPLPATDTNRQPLTAWSPPRFEHPMCGAG